MEQKNKKKRDDKSKIFNDDLSIKNNSPINSRIKRNIDRDRRRSMRYKRTKKEKKYWDREDEILASHIPYDGDATKSPHILINKWFYRWRENCIILKHPHEEGNLKDRQIHYEVSYIGHNIIYKTKKNYLNIQLENTTKKWLLIVTKFEEVRSNPKLCFITESGHLISQDELTKNSDGYVVLAAINFDTKLTNCHDPFSDDEISMAKKFFYNQSHSSKKEYHFNTTGTIHSFGYGPVYRQDPITKHSVARFATSK